MGVRGRNHLSGRGDELVGCVQSAIADVQAFWATKLPAVYGMEYEPIPQDRLVPYSESNPPPACGGSGTTPYKDVANNAFYCSAGDFLAWDAQGLIPTIQQQFGDFAVALVAAHELGHAIQERTGTSAGSTIPLELQADCFAGAWAQHATTTTDDTFNVKKGDLEEALSGYLYFRDPYGDRPHEGGRARVGVRSDLRLQRRILGRRRTVQELRHSTADRHRDPLHQQQ